MSNVNSRNAIEDNVALGLGLMVVFALIAPGIDIFAKLATDYAPPGEVALARFVVQFAALSPVVLWRGGLRGINLASLRLHALRGAFLGIATVTFITAVSKMPVADAISIFFVEPLILTLLGGTVSGRARRLAALSGMCRGLHWRDDCRAPEFR